MGRRHWLLIVLDWVLIALTIVGVMGLFFALIAQFVSPTTTTFFAFFALAYPIISIFNIVMAFMWILRWRGWGLIVLTLLVWGAFYGGRFVQVDIVKHYDHIEPHGERELSISTFNIHGFNGTGVRNVEGVIDYIKAFNSDIICFQEFDIADSVEYKLADSLLFNWPYRAHTYNSLQGHFTLGQAIYSKIPISRTNKVLFEHSENSAIYVDVYWDSDTVRLFNCHLQTTSFNSVTGERGVRAVMGDDNKSQIARSVVGRLRDNFRLRGPQADTLADLQRLSPYNVVVVGDLNSPPMTYTYRTMRGGLSDAFMEAGSGYGYTYKPMAKLFRIDYLFFDPLVMECISYISPEQGLSDHNPVIVKLKSTKR